MGFALGDRRLLLSRKFFGLLPASLSISPGVFELGELLGVETAQVVPSNKVVLVRGFEQPTRSQAAHVPSSKVTCKLPASWL